MEDCKNKGTAFPEQHHSGRALRVYLTANLTDFFGIGAKTMEFVVVVYCVLANMRSDTLLCGHISWF
jgi:hypothetical protein